MGLDDGPHNSGLLTARGVLQPEEKDSGLSPGFLEHERPEVLVHGDYDATLRGRPGEDVRVGHGRVAVANGRDVMPRGVQLALSGDRRRRRTGSGGVQSSDAVDSFGRNAVGGVDQHGSDVVGLELWVVVQ